MAGFQVAKNRDDATGQPVLQVRNLTMYLFSRWGETKAVDGVSFDLRAGETLGLVGESGSGKTMTALSLLRLVPKPGGRFVDGEVLLDGEDILTKSEEEMRHIRGRKISMILQDPQTSLNPVFTIGNQMGETLAGLYTHERKAALRERALSSLSGVRVADPPRVLASYPHHLSGGMKQRVVGAIAIAPMPKVLVADEPTTSLDVTVQIQYLRLLKQIQAETGVAILFITHDFGVVARMCDKVAVMYAGRIVEQGSVFDIYDRPAHPYTQALLASVPTIEEKVDRLHSIEGQPPALFALPQGCRFAPRCPHSEERCRADYPPLFSGPVGHSTACWRLEGQWSKKP